MQTNRGRRFADEYKPIEKNVEFLAEKYSIKHRNKLPLFTVTTLICKRYLFTALAKQKEA